MSAKKNRPDDDRAPRPEPPAREGGHLQYLLTAYLFDNLSGAGKEEVETHLAACAGCRAELEELRETLGEVKEALAPPADGSGYSFEARRLERVLAASREPRPHWTRRKRVWVPLAAAALLAVCVRFGFSELKSARSPGSTNATPPMFAYGDLDKQRNFLAVTSDPARGDAWIEDSGGVSGAGVPSESDPAVAATVAGGESTGVAAPPSDPVALAGRYRFWGVQPPADPTQDRSVAFYRRDPADPKHSLGIYDGKTPGEQQDLEKLVGKLAGEKAAPEEASEIAFAAGATPLVDGSASKKAEAKASVEFHDISDLIVVVPDDPAPPLALQEPAKPPPEKPAPPPPGKVDPSKLLAILENEFEAKPQIQNGKLMVKATPENQAKVKEVLDGLRKEKQALAAAGTTPARGKAAGVQTWSYSVSDLVRREELPRAKISGVEMVPEAGNTQEQGKERSKSEKVLDLLLKQLSPVGQVDCDGNTLTLIVKDSPETHARMKKVLEDLRAAKDPALLAANLSARGQPELAVESFDVSYLFSPGEDVYRAKISGVELAGTTPQPDGEVTKAGKALQLLQQQLSPTGQMDFDPTTRSLIVKDSPETQARVKKLLEDLRAAKDVQVAVESPLEKSRLEFQENFLAEIGVDLGQTEERLRAYRWASALDRSLTPEVFQAHRFDIPAPAPGDEGLGEEGFRKRYRVNPFVETARDRLSTFGMDVDTASYTLARDLLRSGKLPDPKLVRVEEFVNHFREELAADPRTAFSVSGEGGPSPFGEGLDLLKITVKARELAPDEQKPAVLTFAVDTSGSMHAGGRLALVRESLKTLVKALRPEDRVAIVAYSAQAWLALPHTPAREEARILGALDSLAPGGGTNVDAGLELAYRLADEVFERRAINRVILCSDGVANVGARGPDEVLEKVQVFARRGIYLSAVGFGSERYHDRMMQTLADRGNGNHAFVDSPAAAEEIFRKNLPSTLQVLARDAKVQVDWNPEVVSRYRLLGYEKRDVADRDFRNDAVDAGEVGPGTTVTVLYEVQRRPEAAGELARIHLRYLDTGTGRVDELEYPLAPGVLAAGAGESSERFRFIACVAETAELLRQSYWARNGSFGKVLEVLASLGPESRARPECRELVELVTVARDLTVKALSEK